MDKLPRKLKKKEASKTPKVMDWFQKNYPFDVTVEVKVGKNKVKDHQNAALEQVADGSFKWKIPDMGRRNPFDFIVLRNSDVHAIVVTVNGSDCQAYVYNTKKTFNFKI